MLQQVMTNPEYRLILCISRTRLLHRNPPAMHRSMKLCVILWISIWAEGTPWYICRRGLVFESGMLWQM